MQPITERALASSTSPLNDKTWLAQLPTLLKYLQDRSPRRRREGLVQLSRMAINADLIGLCIRALGTHTSEPWVEALMKDISLAIINSPIPDSVEQAKITGGGR